MTDVPDPQPPAPEASAFDLVVKIRKAHADAMMALAADVHPYSGQAVRDHEEAHEETLVALAARLREAERERDEARRAMQYYCGRAQDAERERDDLFHAFQEIWDDWGKWYACPPEALPLLRSELDWLIGFATPGMDGQHDENAWQNRLVGKLRQARALLGSGEGQEPGCQGGILMSDLRPPLPLSKAAINLNDGTAIRACEDPMHIFADRPGWCQCGERYWDDEPLTSDDIPGNAA